MKVQRARKNAIEILRKRAEKALERGRLQELSKEDVQSLAHELGVHQVELEIQNEELREAQKALERSSRRYEDLYEFAPAGHFTFNIQGKILELNNTGATLLGKDKTFLQNKSFIWFIPDRAEQDHFRMVLKEVFMTGTCKAIDIKLRKANKAAFHAQLQFARARQSTADLQFCWATLIDITDQKRAEEQLKKAKELGDALNNINEGIHSTRDFDAIMQQVIVVAAKAIEVDASAIGLFQDGNFVIRYVYNMPESVVGR